MRLSALAVLFLTLFSTVTNVTARSLRRSTSTNAERLARGLGPARPRRLYSGTRTNAARAVPSGVAGSTQRGYIRFVTAGTTTYYGVMSLSGFTTSSVGAETYDFPEPASAAELFELVDEGRPTYHLGAFTTDPTLRLGPTYATYAFLKNIQSVETPAGSPSASATAYGSQTGYAQTTIFSADPDTGKMTVHWVNSDGSVIYPSIYVYQTNVYLTSNIVRLMAAIPTGVFTQVDMYLAG